MSDFGIQNIDRGDSSAGSGDSAYVFTGKINAAFQTFQNLISELRQQTNAAAEGKLTFDSLSDADAYYTVNPPIDRDLLFQITRGASQGEYTRLLSNNTSRFDRPFIFFPTIREEIKRENQRKVETNLLSVANQTQTDGNVTFNVNGVLTRLSDVDANFISNEDAFSFYGTQKIIIEQPLNFTNGGTIFIRCKVNQATGIQRILSNGRGFNPTTANAFFIVPVSNGGNDDYFAIQIGNTTIRTVNLPFNISGGNYLDLALTFKPSGEVGFSIDGQNYSVSGNSIGGIINTNRPLVLGNLDNNGIYNRSFTGNIKKIRVFERELSSSEITSLMVDSFDITSAVVNVDFSNRTEDIRDALYFEDVDGNKVFRRYVENGLLVEDKKESDVWVRQLGLDNGLVSRNTLAISSLNKEKLFQTKTSSDGWGSGVTPMNTNVLNPTAIDLGLDLTNVVGESFNGMSFVREWLVLVPQDYHSVVFYNTITGEQKETDVSSYVRAIPSTGNDYRDKFNGAVYDGEFIWLCPSWTTHVVKLNGNTFEIDSDILVNPNRDDAYNGIINTNKYLWLVTHSTDDIVRIKKSDNTFTRFPISEINGHDYHLYGVHGAAARSFLGGSNNGDGTINLHPRRSNALITIDEETGGIIGSYEHPLSNTTNNAAGWFHGATLVSGKIFFSPFSTSDLVIFDTTTKSFNTIDNALSSGRSIASTTDGRFVYFSPFEGQNLLCVDSATLKVETISCAIPDRESAALYCDNGIIWFGTSIGDNIHYAKISEIDNIVYGDSNVKGSVLSNVGEYYFGSDLRFKRVNQTVEIQQFVSGSWTRINTLG